jgi:hypothetical protein
MVLQLTELHIFQLKLNVAERKQTRNKSGQFHDHPREHKYHVSLAIPIVQLSLPSSFSSSVQYAQEVNPLL